MPRGFAPALQDAPSVALGRKGPRAGKRTKKKRRMPGLAWEPLPVVAERRSELTEPRGWRRDMHLIGLSPHKPSSARNNGRARRSPRSAQKMLNATDPTQKLPEQGVLPRSAGYMSFEWIEERDAPQIDLRLRHMADAVRKELEEAQALLWGSFDTRTVWLVHVAQLRGLLQTLLAARKRLGQIRSLTPEDRAAIAEVEAAAGAAAAAKEALRRAQEHEAQAMHHAATRVQSVARGRRGRRIAVDRQELRRIQVDAACQIQALHRGQQDRAKVRKLREERMLAKQQQQVEQAEQRRLQKEAAAKQAKEAEEQRQAELAAVEAEQRRLREEAAAKQAKEAEEQRQAELATVLLRKLEEEVAGAHERLRVAEEQRAAAVAAVRMADEQAARVAEEELARKLIHEEEEARLAADRAEADKCAMEREQQLLKSIEEADVTIHALQDENRSMEKSQKSVEELALLYNQLLVLSEKLGNHDITRQLKAFQGILDTESDRDPTEEKDCAVCWCAVADFDVALRCQRSQGECHVICFECAGRTITSECAGTTGRYEQSLPSSGPGKLPCPMFPDECDCGELDEAAILNSVANDRDVQLAYLSARSRVALREAEKEAAQQRIREGIDRAVLKEGFAEALAAGATMLCPGCGTKAIKDSACIHMHSRQCCTASWCYPCGRLQSECKRSCEENGQIFMHKFTGWGKFAIGDEQPGDGAVEEFHRRRMAFFLRLFKEQTDPAQWEQLQQDSEVQTMLQDTPTAGRRITWEEISKAEMPLFGQTTVSDLPLPPLTTLRQGLKMMQLREDNEKLRLEAETRNTELDQELRRQYNAGDWGQSNESLEEVYNFVQRFMQEHPEYQHLDRDDLVAARVYTREHVFRSFNREMRGVTVIDEPPPELRSMYVHLKNAVTHLKGVKQGVTLYRGQDKLYGEKYLTGEVVAWLDFRSTSLDLETAKQFAGPSGVVFVIEGAPENLGCNLTPLSEFAYEREILFPPGPEFKVKKREMQGHRKFITLEYVTARGTAKDAKAAAAKAARDREVAVVQATKEAEAKAKVAAEKMLREAEAKATRNLEAAVAKATKEAEAKAAAAAAAKAATHVPLSPNRGRLGRTMAAMAACSPRKGTGGSSPQTRRGGSDEERRMALEQRLGTVKRALG